MKDSGAAKPWSTDPVFHVTYFCNVHREDDKTTKWIRDNWHGNGASPNRHLLAMSVARYVNKPETLHILGYPWRGFDLEYCDRFVQYMMATPRSFSGAYIISTNGNSIPKQQYVAKVLQGIDKSTQVNGAYPFDTLEGTYNYLIKQHGVGSFMAAQILADLKNTPWHPLSHADDWWNWCAHGPGSLKGLTWVWGREKKFTPTEFKRYFPTLHAAVEEAGWEIHAQDLQNCLCEFDKYMRVKNGTGRSKRKYAGI